MADHVQWRRASSAVMTYPLIHLTDVHVVPEGPLYGSAASYRLPAEAVGEAARALPLQAFARVDLGPSGALATLVPLPAAPPVHGPDTEVLLSHIG
ncbi:hypothetical protein ACIBQ6_24330 [Nonomuraea sp. NPDC049655]|uniref:hypothetical protein n=1 Tax=Nonomuraea sp. NPDC049655 TaxID=3364355 RepID=UPI00378759CA